VLFCLEEKIKQLGKGTNWRGIQEKREKAEKEKLQLTNSKT